jgi:transposase
MLGGGKVKRIYEMYGAGRSIREIARVLDMSRNTVRRYLRSPGVPRPAPRPQRPSKLEPYHEYIRQRVADGVENCVALLRELRAQGYRGGITILKDFVRPLRQPRQPAATVRFETEPGEQAQVDFGSVRYRTPEGGYRRLWVFVMVQSWSRMTYVEFVPRADTATFIRCHVHAFERLGVPKRCLYDNAKLVVLERDEQGEPIWNAALLDFALRLGFEVRLCRPRRPQTKGIAAYCTSSGRLDRSCGSACGAHEILEGHGSPWADLASGPHLPACGTGSLSTCSLRSRMPAGRGSPMRPGVCSGGGCGAWRHPSCGRGRGGGGTTGPACVPRGRDLCLNLSGASAAGGR